MSAARMGHIVSPETREKIAATRRGSANAAWKGEAAGYAAKHVWLHRNVTKVGVCSNCHQVRKTEWANISGTYRRSPDDYQELCPPCHRRRDIARRRAKGV